MTEEELAELERLARAATPGPWVVEEYRDPDDNELCWYVGMKENETHKYWDVDSSVLKEMDAAYIAAANPQSVQRLIKECRTGNLVGRKLGAVIEVLAEHKEGMDPAVWEKLMEAMGTE